MSAIDGKRVRGFNPADVLDLRVEAEDEQVTVAFGPREGWFGSAPDGLSVHYVLNIDTDADGLADYVLNIGSDDGWRASVLDVDAATVTDVAGPMWTGEGEPLVSVPLATLGSPTEMRLQGLAQVAEVPDSSDATVVPSEWEDRVPDAVDEWRALGDSDQVPDYLVASQLADELRKAKVDRKATYRQARSALDRLYKDSRYKAKLKGLFDGKYPIKKQFHIEDMKQCEKETFDEVKALNCGFAIARLLVWASNFPADSADPLDAKVRAGFIRVASTLRSAAVNDGLPRKAMDRELRGSSKEWRDNCGWESTYC